LLFPEIEELDAIGPWEVLSLWCCQFREVCRISAGIDMALHLVARLAGETRARDVRRGIQYDPAPPCEHLEEADEPIGHSFLTRHGSRRKITDDELSER
jgi:hypothetical protein